MTTEGFKHRLTTILSADVKGYGRLMGEDETATVHTLTAYREVMATLIRKHRGRVVDSTGHHVLAEFASVMEAVHCAVKIQRELRTRNAEVPENRRVKFRIGINLGDVVEEREGIYGDGVKIAARVASLARGEGICLSGSAYDQIKNKLASGYEYMGEYSVKAISEPVRVYRARMQPGAAGRAMGRITEPAVEPLIEALKDRDWWVRKSMAEALGEIGDGRAVEPLIEMLQDEDRWVCGYAARALGEIGDTRAVEPLIEALQDQDWWMSQSAAIALGRIGDARAVEPLIRVLQDEDRWVCEHAAEALGEIGDTRAVEPLIEALQNRNWWVSEHAAEALGRIGETRAVEPLIEVLRDRDWWVSQGAAIALGRIGDKRAVEPLIEALQHSDSKVRYYAAEALGKICDPRALPHLEQTTRKDTGKTWWGDSVADTAAKAMERIRAGQHGESE